MRNSDWKSLLKFLAICFALVATGLIVGVASADDPVVNPGEWKSNDAGIVWITPNTGYLIYSDDNELLWTKTVNAGTSWSSPTTIDATCDVGALGIWFDRWTNGDSGTRIHISWHRNQTGECGGNVINYDYLDTATDTLGGTVATAVTAYAAACQSGGNPCEISIAKTESGRLYIHATLTTSSFQQRFLISTDGGATWLTGSLGPGGTEFRGMILPRISDTNGNDVSAFTIQGQVLFWDSDSNTWSVQDDFSGDIIGTDCSTNAGLHRACMSRGINTAVGTGETIAFYGIMTDSTIGNPHNFYVIRQGFATVELVSTVFTNLTDVQNIGLMFDTTHDTLYAFYMQTTADELNYRVSTDLGETWGDEIRFDDTANAKTRLLTAPSITLAGGRLMPAWNEAPAIVTNLDNAVELIADSPVDTQDFQNRLDRFVEGIGFRGESGKFWFAALTSLILAAMMLVFRAPRMVTLGITGYWATIMRLVEYLPIGIYLSALAVFGVITIFVVLRMISGGESEDNY